MRLLGAGTAEAVAVTSNRISSSALLGRFISSPLLAIARPRRGLEHAIHTLRN
jgi:hypothetical protein